MPRKKHKKKPGPPRSGKAEAQISAKVSAEMANYLREVPGGGSYGVRRALCMLMEQHPDPAKVVGMDLDRPQIQDFGFKPSRTPV